MVAKESVSGAKRVSTGAQQAFEEWTKVAKAFKCNSKRNVHDLLKDFVGHIPGELARVVNILRIVVSVLEGGLGLGAYLE